MSKPPKVKGVQFYVLGAGKSGVSVAKLLKKNDAVVFVTEQGVISKDTERELLNHQIPFEFGLHSEEKIKNECDVLVISPGIPLSTKIPMLCKKLKIPIVSEIEVASWFIPKKCVILAVTGTNGKSTTTNYLAQLLNRGGFNSLSCGNIGKSLSSIIDSSQKNIHYALELSSYQLETTHSLKPHCTILLNLQNDHLNRYQNIEEYFKAKWRLVLMTEDNGIAIIDRHALKLAIDMGLSLPRSRMILVESSSPTKFSSKINMPVYGRREYDIRARIFAGRTLPNSIYHDLKKLKDTEILSECEFEIAYAKYNKANSHTHVLLRFPNREIVWEIKNPCLAGEHNMLNILCASLIGMHFGLDEKVILSQWESETSRYEHLPHRIEKIAKKDTVYIDSKSIEKHIKFINDSKATNVESTVVALKAFTSPIRLLLGGEPKGDLFGPVGLFLKKNLIKIYPFGKASAQIYEELKYTKKIAEPCHRMLQAAQKALDESKDGDIILLSPGCSSFDEFQSFEHRGDVFRSWVLNQTKESKIEFE